MHPIIKEYLDKGYIDKEAAVRLQDFEAMTKEASFLNVLKDVWQGIKNVGKDALRTSLGPALGMTAGAYVAHKLDQSAKNDFIMKQKMEMANSYDKMFEMLPKLKNEDPGKIQERFKEIASISPTVASTPQVAAKVLSRTLHKGLDEKDMSSLSQIESNVATVKSIKTPGSPFAKPMQEAVRSIVTPIATEAAHEVIGKNFKEQVQEGMQNLSGASFQEVRDYMGDRRRLRRRIEAAANAGINIPEKIKNMNFAASSKDEEEALSKFMSTPTGQSVFPEAVAWEKGQLMKKANALADIHILVKEAGLPEGFWKGLLTAGALGLGTGLAHVAADEISKSQKKKAILESWDKTKNNLKKMTAEGNQLSLGIDYADSKTQESAKNVFNTLVTVAPDLATNPDIATTYVNRLINAGEVDVQAIKTVSEIQKNMDSVSGYKSPFGTNPLIRGFESGFQTAGGEKFVGELAKQQVSDKKDIKK